MSDRASTIAGPLAPASMARLPPELLANIFKMLGPHPIPSWPRETSLGEPCTLSHVCSDWRAIALSLKTLWTGIPIKNEFWAGLSLERSRPLPILVFVTLDPQNVDTEENEEVLIYEMHDGLQKALSEPHRIRTLKVELETNDFGPMGTWLADKLLLFLEAIEVPLLEYLDVNLSFHSMRRDYTTFLGHLPPPNLCYLSLFGLFQGELPCLHLLEAPLTTLDLGSGYMWDSIHDAFDALSRLPTLEVLAIRRDRDDMAVIGAIPPDDILDENIEPHSISLPNLKKLQVYEPLELVVCLMRSLAFPTSALIDLHDANDETGRPPSAPVRECVQILIAALNAHYAPMLSEERPFRSLFLCSRAMKRREYTQRLQIVADYATQDRESLAPRTLLITDRINSDVHGFHRFRDRPLSISLSNDSSFGALELVEVFTSLPVFREAHALVFNEDTFLSLSESFSRTNTLQWSKTLRHLQSIQVAHLCGPVAVHQCEALIDVVDHRDTPLLAAPNLIIEDVSFLPEPLPYYRDSRPSHMTLDTFVLALQRCRDPNRLGPNARRLTHVKLVHCDIDKEHVSRLRGEFGDEFVSWGGRTRGSGRSRQHARMGPMLSDSE
ncbi:hypothetical protein PENSPDRAFT_655706 [Peniophora sp. CONT]|nr:hypothetical protein PENSPDRAFT_655706 [Peniophora sp. CONT]